MLKRGFWMLAIVFYVVCLAANYRYQAEKYRNEIEAQRQADKFYKAWKVWWGKPQIRRLQYFKVAAALAYDEKGWLMGDSRSGEIRFVSKSATFVFFYFDKSARGGFQELGLAIPEWDGLKIVVGRKTSCPIIFQLEVKAENLFGSNSTRDVCVGWDAKHGDLLLK